MVHDTCRALALLIVPIVLVMHSFQVHACSCRPPRSVADELERAAAVFAGRVMKTEDPATGPIWGSMDSITVTLETSTVWKGALTPTLTVTTPRSGASCGFPFAKGDEYLVYASAGGTGLSVSLCSRTKRVAEAAEDLKELGTGKTAR
jgi:hypothetical protein